MILGGSLAILVFLIVWNSGYHRALETLNTPGTKVVGGHWRGYHSSSLSSLSSSERLAKESAGSDSSSDNPKSGKSNKSDSTVKIEG